MVRARRPTTQSSPPPRLTHAGYTVNLRVRPVRLPLFARIAAGYGLVLLAMVAIAGLTLFRLIQATAITDEITRHDAPAVRATDDLKLQVLAQQLSLSRFLLSSESTPNGKEALLSPYFRAHDAIMADLDTLAAQQRNDRHPGLATALDQIRGQIQVSEAQADLEIAAIRSGTPIEATSAIDFTQADLVRSQATAIDAQLVVHISQKGAESSRFAAQSIWIVIVAFVLGTGLSLAVAVLVTLSISGPLGRLTASAKRIAAGELVEPEPSDRGDEIGSLSRAMTRMVRTLNQQTDELKRSNADLEQFAYIASHDLQEPLRMVSGFTGLLQRRYAGKLGADADEFIGYAISGVNRMQALINDLLSYSRLGREDVAAQPVDMQLVVDQTLANLQTAIEERSALVSSGPLPMVLGNHGMLVRVFQNLVGNALKFCKAERPVVRIAAERQGSEWRFSVADNGIGIDPQYRDRIFLIFQRLHQQGEYPGTGIGLAVVKRIVERNGGRIWLESEPGKGTTFLFTLPATGGQQIAA
jgi:signal transduction histidine kinase